MTRTLIFVLAIGCTLASSSLAIASTHYLALPDKSIGDEKNFIDIAKISFDETGAGDNLTVLNVSSGKPVFVLNVADKRRFDTPKYKNKEYASELKMLQNFVSGAIATPQPSFSKWDADVLAVLRTIGTLHAENTDGAHVLIIAPALHLTSQNMSMSMISTDGDILVPSDGMLTGDNLLSPYGLGTDTRYLENINVNFCALLPDVTEYEFQELTRFWGNYIALRGGKLVSFSNDLTLCHTQYQKRLTAPIKLRPLDGNIQPAMIAADVSGQITQITIDKSASLESELSTLKATNGETIAALEKDIRDKEKKAKNLSEQLKTLTAENTANKTELDKIEAVMNVPESLGGVSTFSRFTKIPHTDLKTVTVTTGVNYKRDDFPQYQTAWCYFEKLNTSGASVTVRIGTKDFGKSIKWKRAKTATLKQIKMSQDQFKSARRSCRFPK